MKVHFIQHVPYEGPAALEAYFTGRGSTMYTTHVYRGEVCPAADTFDVLVIMGGPMNIYETDRYPWLSDEKKFIRNSIDAGKYVLGICLGAQLIADVLGAKVYRNKYREIGWFPVTCTPEVKNIPAFQDLPASFEAFHWHGDTFEIPQGARHLFSSESCRNQGFLFENHVLALQFHLETTPESAGKLIEHGREEMDGSRYAQEEKEILASEERFYAINQRMKELLDGMA